jgi:hypothetical protein
MHFSLPNQLFYESGYHPGLGVINQHNAGFGGLDGASFSSETSRGLGRREGFFLCIRGTLRRTRRRAEGAVGLSSRFGPLFPARKQRCLRASII